MDWLDRLNAAAELGAGELRGARMERKQEIEAKAKHKREQAKSKLQKVKIKADEAREMAELEAAVYQAQINAQNAQRRAKALRHQAGHYTVGERVEQFGKDAYSVGKSFIQGMRTGASGSTRTKVTKKVVRKKATKKVAKKTARKSTTKRKTKATRRRK